MYFYRQLLNNTTKKTNTAKNMNNLSSNNEEFKQKCRRKKNKKTKPCYKSDSEYELPSEVSSLNSVIYSHVSIEGTKSSGKQTIGYMTGYMVDIIFI